VKKLKNLNVFFVLFVMCIIAVVLTWIIPAGKFDRVENEMGITVVDANSFHFIEPSRVSLLEIPTAIVTGLNNMAPTIFFVLIISGAFHIVNASGAFTNLTMGIARKMRGHEKWIVPILTTVFSMLCTTQGVNTLISFAPVCIMLMRSIGYDAMCGAAMVVLGGGIGFSCGALNPQTTGIAHEIAELPLYSGSGFRFFSMAVLLVMTSVYIIRYGEKVKKDKASSIVYDLEIQEASEERKIDEMGAKLTLRQILILLSVVIAYVVVMYNSIKNGWGVKQQASVFLIVAFVAGALSGLGFNESVNAFMKGAKAVISPLMMIGVAAAISVLMTKGNILDTIVYGISNVLLMLPRPLQTIGMYIAQTLINIIIISGSGQVVVTMPIMLPVADIIGMSRQLCVLLFNFGDGFGNQIYPMSGALMAVLGVSNIPFDKWFKFAWKIVVAWMLAGIPLVLLAQLIGY